MHVVLLDGRLYCISTDPDFSRNNFMLQGEKAIAFDEGGPASVGRLLGNLLPSSKHLHGWMLDAAVGSTAIFGLDLLPEWTLDNEPTLYVECDQYPARFKLLAKAKSGRVRFGVRAGLQLLLRAYAACHRCEAKLSVEYFGHDGALVGTEDIVLPEARGGRTLDGYQPIMGKLIAPAGSREAQLSLQYDRPVDPVPGYRSFVFLTGLSLTLPDQGSLAPDLIAELLGSETAEISGTPRLFSALIDVQAFSARDVDLVVRSDNAGGSKVIDHPRKSGVPTAASLDVLDASVLKVGVPEGYNFSLFVDDVRVPQELYHVLDPVERTYKLSTRFNDGGVHRLEIRDESGCVKLAEDLALLPYHQTPWPILQEHCGLNTPNHLSPGAGQRYRSSLAQMHAHVQKEPGEAAHSSLRQIEQSHRVIAKGFGHNTSFLPLRFPRRDAPVVSIVIPVHNKFEVTYFCLCALLFAFTEVSFDVIVVDDGSTDRTVELPRLLENVTYIRNEAAHGFLRAVNLGAERARGDYVLLLNNDTEATYRWLDELVEAFVLFDNVGLVGSKLVYPDGRLQEAGGIVWSNGNPWNYGRLANPFEPRYSYTRDADYLSGAAIMLPRRVWKEVGGFSQEFAPAYFEDTDLAFKVRDRGYRTLFVAPSVVYHFEGVSSGTDITSGVKRYQEINRPLFKRKWRSAFFRHGDEGKMPDLEKDRTAIGRVLVLDYTTPREDVDAGSYAAIQEMRLLQKLGYKVSFFPQNAAYLGEYVTYLQRRGIEMLHAPFFNSLEDVLRGRGREFDAVYITRYYVAREAVPLVRQLAPQAKILFCNADLHFLRSLRGALLSKNPDEMAQALQIRDDELSIMREVDVTLSYNEVEHAVIVSHNFDKSRVMKLPWVEKARELKRPFGQREGLSFLGGFNHSPNIEAVEFLSANVMPLLANSEPDLVLHVFGSHMPARLREFDAPNIQMHGFVEDLGEVFDDRKVFIAPLLSGAGVKGKVLGALARGIPCVLSPVAAEGIGVRHRFDCIIAETPAEWVAAIRELVSDPDLWLQIGMGGQALVRESFSEERGLRMMRDILEAMDLPLPA